MELSIFQLMKIFLPLQMLQNKMGSIFRKLCIFWNTLNAEIIKHLQITFLGSHDEKRKKGGGEK